MDGEPTVTLPSPLFERMCRVLEGVESMLAKHLEEQARTIPNRPMSPAEVAAIVGKHEKTVRRWIGSRKLRAKVEGHVILVRPVDLQRFLEGGAGE